MRGKIFISYRRDDTQATALSIAQFLERTFGGGNVFLDLDVPAGTRFPAAIEKELAESKVLLVLIGPQWLDIRDQEGRRRLDVPDDWVRLEIAHALRRGIVVIPVMLAGAALPQRAALPDDIKELADHQAATIRLTSFKSDMASLVDSIHAIPHRTILSLKIPAAATLLALGGVLIALLAFWNQAPFLKKRISEPSIVQDKSETPLAPRGALPLTSFEERALKPKDVFRECVACPEMTVVPDGFVMMGSARTEVGHEDSERPRHRVGISRPFALGRFEVTRAQFEEFLRATGHDTGDEECYTVRNFGNPGGWLRPAGTLKGSFSYPGFVQDSFHPATCVSWNDVSKYAAWLSKLTGKSYRLATEAEWEYAARAGNTNRFYFGEGEKQLCTYGNVGDLSAKREFPDLTPVECEDGYIFTAPVGRFQPNAFGLFDMHGNVSEWVADCWHDDYDNAPTDGSAWTTAPCEHRVVRGGSWLDNWHDLRIAKRQAVLPYFRVHIYGFRVARTLTAE